MQFRELTYMKFHFSGFIPSEERFKNHANVERHLVEISSSFESLDLVKVNNPQIFSVYSYPSYFCSPETCLL